MSDKVCALFKSERLLIRDVSKEVEILIGLCHATVTTYLGVRELVVKFIPRVLIAEQKESASLQPLTCFSAQNQHQPF
jgi:hypothetical protein